MNEPRLYTLTSNGIRLRVAEQGEGPLVLLLHGWPESWYSWRHQLPWIAGLGYRAVAPDMRGYGGSDAPGAVEAYAMRELCADVVGLIDHYGARTAVLVGHDWGAMVAWQCALLAPERISAVVALSVPYSGRSRVPPTEALRARYGDDFYYMLYFQELGLAEAEFDLDPQGILSRLYASPDTPRQPPRIRERKRSAGGWIDRLGAPKELPAWLRAEDLAYYVTEFARRGFRGGINYYRNLDRNWHDTPQLAGAQLAQPAYFIAGARDVVLAGHDAAWLESLMRPSVPQLRRIELIPRVGHWVQQEVAQPVNLLLREFLAEL
jgi:pimeloyl-ACP methyl ester carboxylesterase